VRGRRVGRIFKDSLEDYREREEEGLIMKMKIIYILFYEVIQ